MTEKQKEKLYKDMVQGLNDIRQDDAEDWGIFFLGTQLFIGNTRVYKAENRARLRLADAFTGYGRAKKEDVIEIIGHMEKSKMLEFRQIGDRSPKFPRNAVEPDQAKRFEEMLDASDDEMVNLAITILSELTKTEKDE